MPKAIGMVEFTSIAKGMYVADQMVKISNVDIVTSGSACPGKYNAIVHGDVASVEDSVKLGEDLAEEFLVDSILIPNVDSKIFPAITGATMPEKVQAIGIIECFSQANMIYAADAILKVADLEPIEIRLGNGLGGKSYFTFTGDVAAVQTGVEAGKAASKDQGLLLNVEVIPSPSEALVASLF
ncbi:BMC domain-containing protein [Proteinivorax tanatarense]|uniref:BMC domain-containing protein n=1 Tax=Proteinivorax tanatarense TaxID=1260629 RepID=A0AAU7VMI2_9FIRM